MASTILADNGASSGSAGIKTTADSTGALALQTSTTGGTATTALTIDTSQNVGVGVSPTYKFDTSGTGVFGSAGGITLTTATNTVGIRGSSATTVGSAALHLGDTLNSSSRQWAVINGYTAQGALNFLVSSAVNTNPAVSGSVAMTLDASGRLMIGSGNAGAPLSFADTAALKIQFNADAANYYGISKLAGGGSLGDGEFKFTSGNVSGGGFTFSSGGSERARIDSSGILRVNNTSTPSGNTGFNGEIAVIGNGSNGSLFYTTASANTGTAVEVTRQNDGAGIYFFRNGSAAGFINITTGAISVNNSSDYRLKENVAPLSGSLAKVMQVRPVTFTWKENGSAGKSVIAHELQDVFPDVVFGEKDATNEDGSIKPQSVALGNLVPDLIAAIQEQQAIITTLTERITALENK